MKELAPPPPAPTPPPPPPRRPLQGVRNIIRFNWPFFALAGGGALALLAALPLLPAGWRPWAGVALALGLLPVLSSLVASAYVYDYSGLYGLGWLPVAPPPGATVLSVSAGFDEIGPVLAGRYAPARLLQADFYDPARHPEASIARARRHYPPAPGLLPVDTRAALPLPAQSVDATFAFLAAHEIRDDAERAAFFRELRRVTRPGGWLVVTEHLRDWPNFLAYSVGFLHFHSRATWRRTFAAAGWQVAREIKVTSFITSFLLRPDGNSA